ncbi:hypothetical protein NKDENANG_03619 [Candidatus Entotheonellaceae bacterium PAL068K]
MRRYGSWMATLLLGCALSVPSAAKNQGLPVEVDYLADLRFTATDFKTTSLAPAAQFRGAPSETFQATAVVTAATSIAGFELTGQLRGIGSVENDGPDHSLTVDEMFVERPVSDHLFVFAGRRNLAFGQAFGVSPTDVFLDPLQEDRSLNEARRRREIEGIDMVGFEAFVAQNASLLAFVAPAWEGFNQDHAIRALTALDLLWPGFEVTITFQAFWDDRPGIGWLMSKTLGNAVILYVEGTARQGRDRRTVVRSGAAMLAQFDVLPKDENDLRASVTLGSGYTFERGLSINLEYYRNGDGYSDREWAVLDDLISRNATHFDAGLFNGLPSQNLQILNDELRLFALRRNYLFARLFDANPIGVSVSGELTVFHNLDDGSGVVSTRLETDIKDRVTIGFLGSATYGGSHTEFGLRPTNYRGVAYVTVHF